MAATTAPFLHSGPPHRLFTLYAPTSNPKTSLLSFFSSLAEVCDVKWVNRQRIDVIFALIACLLLIAMAATTAPLFY